MCTYTAKLVYHSKPAQYGVIAYFYVTCETGTIGKYRVVTNDTVMRDMHISHQEIIITDTGNAITNTAAPVQSTVLANYVTFTNFQPGVFSLVPRVLRRVAN